MKKYKEVSRTATDIKKHKGTPFEGEYLGKDEIETKIGQQVIYRFRDDGGNPFSIYGFTNLNRCMEHLAIGTDCRITYLGTENVKTKFGMKDVHQVRVEIAEDAEEAKDTLDTEVSFL